MENELTGRKVFAIAATGFGIVIAANMTMLYFSTQSFPGLVVENSYVASQSFDGRVAAQRALGWKSTARIENGAVVVGFSDGSGGVVAPDSLVAKIGRPTLAAKTIELARERVTGLYKAAPELGPGLWQLDLEATAEDGTLYEAHFDLIVPEADR